MRVGRQDQAQCWERIEECGIYSSVVDDERDCPCSFGGDAFRISSLQNSSLKTSLGEPSYRGSRIMGSGIRDDYGGSGHGHLHWATGPKNGQYPKTYLLLPRGTSVPPGSVTLT